MAGFHLETNRVCTFWRFSLDRFESQLEFRVPPPRAGAAQREMTYDVIRSDTTPPKAVLKEKETRIPERRPAAFLQAVVGRVRHGSTLPLYGSVSSSSPPQRAALLKEK